MLLVKEKEVIHIPKLAAIKTLDITLWNGVNNENRADTWMK
jgi:hypothetical protein